MKVRPRDPRTRAVLNGGTSRRMHYLVHRRGLEGVPVIRGHVGAGGAPARLYAARLFKGGTTPSQGLGSPGSGKSVPSGCRRIGTRTTVIG